MTTAVDGIRARSRATSSCTVHLVVALVAFVALELPRLVAVVPEGTLRRIAPVTGYNDFDHGYYYAGRAITAAPDTLFGGSRFDSTSGKIDFVNPAHFLNIPLIAWFFVPFAQLPPATAGVVLLILNIAATLGSLYLLQRRLRGQHPWLRWGVTVTFITSGPLLNGFHLGQTTPIVLLALLLAEHALHRQRDTAAGLWLGLACLIKVPPMLFIPYFAFRRRWSVVVAAVTLLTTAWALSLWLHGWSLHVDYFNVAFRAQWGTILAAHNCQSLDALLARLFTDAGLWSWLPIRPSPAVKILRYALIGVLVGAAGWVLARSASPPSYRRLLLELAVTLCLSLIILPITWVHYGAWLLPVGAVLGSAALGWGEHGRVPHRNALLVLILAMLLINVPVPPYGIIERFGDAVWFRVAISHQLFGTILLYGMCLWSLWRRLDGPAPELGT